MFTKLRLALILAVIGLVVGGAFVATKGQAQAKPTQFQATNMIVAGGGPPVPGGATLTRSNNEVSYRIYTSELTPGHAYTVWMVIFNNPEACVDGCGGDDLARPEVEASIVYGGGYLAGANGNGNFHGTLHKGTPPAGIEVNVPAGTANGLSDPMGATIHLVVRTHGAPVAGKAGQQFSTFEDGCPTCANVQAAEFDAP